MSHQKGEIHMKKVTLYTTAVLASLIVTGIATTASADEVATYDAYGAIKYTPSTNVTDPIDPLNPTQPVTPENPDPTIPVVPGTPGPLSIDFASSFDFGTQEITSEDMVYSAAAQKYKDATGNATTGPNYVQVTDNRGTLAGWSLTVKMGDFASTDSASAGKPGATLDGAKVYLTNATIASASKTPADKVKTITTLDPNVQSDIVMGATDGNGAGTNLVDFGNDSTKDSSVKLEIPGASTKLASSYKATITWSLSDTPAN